jgi:hypothetical protein
VCDSCLAANVQKRININSRGCKILNRVNGWIWMNGLVFLDDKCIDFFSNHFISLWFLFNLLLFYNRIRNRSEKIFFQQVLQIFRTKKNFLLSNVPFVWVNVFFVLQLSSFYSNRNINFELIWIRFSDRFYFLFLIVFQTRLRKKVCHWE